MEQFDQTEQLFAYQPGQTPAAPDTAAPDRNPLTVQCDRTPNGKLQRKTEFLAGTSDEYAYAFDTKGRLTDVRLNGRPLETYRYNASGQRILQVCHHGGLRQNERQYRYNGNGALTQAGRAEFYYDRNGALGQRCDDGGAVFFEYGNGSRLDKVHRRDGWEIRYEYGPYNPQPVRRFRSGRLTHEYVWLDASRLSVCRDHYNGIEYQFSYGEIGKLDRLRLVNLLHIDPRANGGMWGNPLPAGSAEDKARLKAARLDHFYEAMARNNRKSPRSLFDESYAPREFLCCVDQVGTLRALVAMNGAVIKEIKRDSFGIPYYDSFPGFALPIGFAGGLTDPDTGLVRFGWRDYDPTVGRFTALDPARDRRGDGDLYDYCMDDPVSRVDPTGLWSKENFDESQVHRDPEGKFAPTGAGSGSGGGGSGGADTGGAKGSNSEPQQAADDTAALGAASAALVSTGVEDMLWDMAYTRLGRFITRGLARLLCGVSGPIGDALFPDELNAPEKMYLVREEAIAIEKKITAGTATENDEVRLMELYKEELSLRKRFGDALYDGPAFEHLFPKKKKHN